MVILDSSDLELSYGSEESEGKLHVMSSGLLNTSATIILPCSGGWLCYAYYIGDRG